MFKLFHKKLNKKGFTLAELLIVVAIIAVLVAMAIPIYTGLLERAQVGVNTANARSLKGAAVATILGDWDILGGGAKDAPTSAGNKKFPANGWFAEGKFDEHGNIENIHVYMAAAGSLSDDVKNQYKEGVVYKQEGDKTILTSTIIVTDDHYVLTTNPTGASGSKSNPSNGVKVADSGEVRPVYHIVVYVDDLNEIVAGDGFSS